MILGRLSGNDTELYQSFGMVENARILRVKTFYLSLNSEILARKLLQHLALEKYYEQQKI